jgi:hypothetical protein
MSTEGSSAVRTPLSLPPILPKHTLTPFSSTQPQDSNTSPKEFKIQLLPAGSVPRKDTNQPDVNCEFAPGQPKNSADTTYAKAIDVHKGLGDEGLSKNEKDEREGHRAEIKSVSERVPESADSI